jgi:hypothetical protein
MSDGPIDPVVVVCWRMRGTVPVDVVGSQPPYPVNKGFPPDEIPIADPPPPAVTTSNTIDNTRNPPAKTSCPDIFQTVVPASGVRRSQSDFDVDAVTT